MKSIVNIARVLVGSLYIFSGLIKAIDPLGLSYKMQEFFEVWANSGFLPKMMMQLHQHSLAFSIFMITFEVILGVALLLGCRIKITAWLLFLLTLFFTFLTAFVLFSGKIRACGCFGDCIPLTPIQTFSKDIVLTILILFILFGQKYIKPILTPKFALPFLLIALALTLGLQKHVLAHLPAKDCLPFKVGNNILELRKMPANAVPDKFDYTFIYQKNGEKKEFRADALPDSTWQYADRKQVLIEKGKNNEALINDFFLKTAFTSDTTEAVLSQEKTYFLLFVKDAKAIPENWIEDEQVAIAATQKKIPIYIVAAERENTSNRFENLAIAGVKINIPIFTCDATAIKTAARNNVTLYKMQGPIVQQKWGGDDIKKALQ